MEYDKTNNLLGSESENLSKFVTGEYVRVNNLSNTYNEINQLDLKRLCYDQIYAIMQICIF